MPELLVMGAHTSGSALSTKKGVDIIVQSSEFILCVQLSLSAMPNEHVRSTQQYRPGGVGEERAISRGSFG